VDSTAPIARRPGRRPRESGYIVRASELGSYAYCERAWWLRYVAGLEPAGAGRARLEAGNLRHAEHGRGVERAALLWRAGVLCAGLAGAVALLWALIALLVH
jgi:hypothetical protein